MPSSHHSPSSRPRAPHHSLEDTDRAWTHVAPRWALARAALVCLTTLCAVALTACGEEQGSDDAPIELLFYCGITMAHPMGEIARRFEERHGVKITISQGGSEDLYQSLASSRQGDLYLPGSPYYRRRHLADGLLGESVHIGYNQAAMMVAKGNPKRVRPDLHELLRKDLSVVICNPESGSIGNETERILEGLGIDRQVRDNVAFLTTDSRNLNRALRKGVADLILNWRATAFFEENRAAMDLIDIDPEYAVPKRLELSLVTLSEHAEIARAFMAYAASHEGQAIFRRWGFLDSQLHSDRLDSP